jgi:hypothetical protein
MKEKQNNSQLFLVPGVLVGIAVILFVVVRSLSPNARDIISAPAAAVYPGLTPVESMTPQVSSAPEMVIPKPVDLSASEQAIPPNPRALSLLIASEINSATPKENGYVVTTTFGANWFLSQQQVEALPKSMQIRIDYSKYGAGAHGN